MFHYKCGARCPAYNGCGVWLPFVKGEDVIEMIIVLPVRSVDRSVFGRLIVLPNVQKLSEL